MGGWELALIWIAVHRLRQELASSTCCMTSGEMAPVLTQPLSSSPEILHAPTGKMSASFRLHNHSVFGGSRANTPRPRSTTIARIFTKGSTRRSTFLASPFHKPGSPRRRALYGSEGCLAHCTFIPVKQHSGISAMRARASRADGLL